MNKHVIVVMSTYNGATNIERQLDSIINQVGVDVSILVRDDGSNDSTVNVLDKYKEMHPECTIEIVQGTNEGYAKSFWDAINGCPAADYYAFSDQDDVWKNDKLIKTIAPMERDSYNGPKLAYCNMERSDTFLNPLDEQVKVLTPSELSKKLVLTQTFNYGAATVINEAAKKLMCRCWPNIVDLPHDMWIGLLCYWFGRIYYVNEKLYFWIRYQHSVTGAGTQKSGMKYRLKESMQKKSYPNVSVYLLKYYDDLLNDTDKIFLNKVAYYKTSILKRLSLLFDWSFSRKSIAGTLFLKMGVLFGWF